VAEKTGQVSVSLRPPPNELPSLSESIPVAGSIQIQAHLIGVV